MALLLGCRSSARGQGPEQRDTHGVAAAQLLLQELDGCQMGDAGSLASFWCPVHREGRGRELGEPQAVSCLLSGSCARELLAATGAPSPAGGCVPPSVQLLLEHPPGLPQQCGHPQLLQCLGSAGREERERQALLPPALGKGGCLHSPAPWGRTEALSKPWVALSCLSGCVCPSLLGTKR